MPLIHDIFDPLQGISIFLLVEIKSGFHQLPLQQMIKRVIPYKACTEDYIIGRDFQWD